MSQGESTIPQIELPDTLHELLTMGLDDLERCMEQGFEVDMANWLRHFEEKPCSVCLAGAIMAQHGDGVGILKKRRETWAGIQEMLPNSYAPDTARKLRALNHLRCAWYSDALEMMYPGKYTHHERWTYAAKFKAFNWPTVSGQPIEEIRDYIEHFRKLAILLKESNL